MAQVIQLHRTTTNNVPAGPGLQPGVMSVGIPAAYTRVWIGDGAMARLLISNDPADAPMTLTTVAHDGSLLNSGTKASPLRVMPASAAQIAGGSDVYASINSAGLRGQMGADAAMLLTTQKTVVPAINELWTLVEALGNNLTVGGGYDAATDDVNPVLGGILAAGPLPVADASNIGIYVIVQVAGTGHNNAPAGAPLEIGDWLLSNGTEWLYFSMGISEITAEGIEITIIPGMTAVNVQEALEWLQSSKIDQGTADLRYLQLSGGTLSGPLTLNADPTLALHAATKAYVDNELLDYVPLAGGIMTGDLILPGPPNTGLAAATKDYVDQQVSAGTVFTDGTSILGNGLVATPLRVGTVDGGQY